MKALVEPEKLKSGDTVAFIAPSGLCDPSRIQPAVETFNRWGFCVTVMESVYARENFTDSFLAGCDDLRARDIMTAFTDPEIKGIFAFRGGYGAQRLLPLLNFETIAKHPKIFAGYSDITALHTALNQRCGFVTYHAPMPGVEFYHQDLDRYTEELFLSHICEEGSRLLPDTRLTPILPGYVEGVLTGGNLSLLASSIGTPFEIETQQKILFIEDIQEPPYRIDRMLLQLQYAGKLSVCAGFLLGDFSPENEETLRSVIAERLFPLKKPIWSGLPCGHCLPNATLPMGLRVCIKDGVMGFIRKQSEESYVRFQTPTL